MSSNFLEINNATFIASDNNKVKNVSLTIKKKGEIIFHFYIGRRYRKRLWQDNL